VKIIQKSAPKPVDVIPGDVLVQQTAYTQEVVTPEPKKQLDYSLILRLFTGILLGAVVFYEPKTYDVFSVSRITVSVLACVGFIYLLGERFR